MQGKLLMYIIEGNGALISWVPPLMNLFCSIRGNGKTGGDSTLGGSSVPARDSDKASPKQCSCFLLLHISYISFDVKVRLGWITTGLIGLLCQVNLLFKQMYCGCLQLTAVHAVTTVIHLSLVTASRFKDKYHLCIFCSHSISC